MIFVTHIDMTPNPNALKFVLNDQILSSGNCQYDSKEAVPTDDNLARSLFEISGVIRVFYADNYITVSKEAKIDWLELENTIKDVINAHVESVDFKSQKKEKVDFGIHSELIEQIEELLDETIRPGLSMDGGGVDIISINKDKKITILYHGACGSCPSAQTGTLMAIERMIQENIDPEVTVISTEENFF